MVKNYMELVCWFIFEWFCAGIFELHNKSSFAGMGTNQRRPERESPNIHVKPCE